MEGVVFKRWTNKGWAAFSSLNKVVIIGILCVSYQLMAQEQVGHRPDSSRAAMILELEEVETTADWPAALEELSLKPVLVIESRDFAAAAASSHEDILEYLPQLDIRQRGKHGTQADLSIQGGTFDQSMVLLNGINLSDPQSGHFQLNLPLDLYATEQIEVLTGSASRAYGMHAFSGAVNMVTQPSDSTYFTGGLKAGQHRYYQARMKANLSGDRVRTMASFSTAGSDGYRANTDFRNTHAYLHTVLGKKKFRTHLMAGLNVRDFGANAFYTPRFPQQYEETTTGLTALKVELEKARTQWTLNAYFRVNRDHFLLDRENPSFYQNDHLTRVTGADLDSKISTSAGITHAGIHYRGEQIRSTSLGEPFDPEDVVSYRDSLTFTHGHLRNHFNGNLNHSWEVGPLALAGGFMIHMNSDLGYRPEIYPGVDVRFRISESTRIYSSLNRSMRMPTFTDLYYEGPTNVGNPDLQPERALTWELGTHSVLGPVSVGLNSFYRQGRDMIDWIWTEDEVWYTMNLTEVDAMGGDLRFVYRAPENELRGIRLASADASYSFTRLSRVSDDVISRYILDPLKHKLVAGAVLELGRSFLLSARFTAQDREGSFQAFDTDTGESSEEAYEPFALLDLKLGYRIHSFFFYTEISNVTGTDYQDIGNLPQPGRWMMVGVEIR